MQVSGEIQGDKQCGGRHPDPWGGRHLFLRVAVVPPWQHQAAWRCGLADHEHSSRWEGYVCVWLYAVCSRVIRAKLQAALSHPWEDGARRVPPQGVFPTGHGLDRQYIINRKCICRCCHKHVYTIYTVHVPGACFYIAINILSTLTECVLCMGFCSVTEVFWTRSVHTL